MFELSQFVAGRFGELGVQSQYLDGELHLIDDALAGTVPAIEKLEVFYSIIRSNTIDMMDGFFGKQVATNVLGHYVSVLQHRMFYACDETWYCDPNVSVTFSVFANFTSIKFYQSTRALVCGFAFFITVFLLFVYATAWFATFWIYFTTFKAGKRVSRFASFASSYARTLARAIPRIACIFFMICINKRFHHRKFLVAFSTSKFYDGLSYRQRLFETVRAAARETAVFSVFTGKTGKRSLAVFTNFLNRHWWSPLFGDEGTLPMSFGMVK